ncbi:MerR family transcriptional regulator [Nocardia sp. NPDC050710]|uniref:MerR family transcriptional regulator n=1 Tax=Nocardia sp. NPDC050710 TaxID=3157220 RepID=UPI0033FACA39
MRIAELSARSGVPVPTIKYYLREGLLAAGERSSPNQASYDEDHLRRLRLIRALIEVGGLPVAAVGDVLAAVDEPELPMYSLLGVVSASLHQPQIPPDDDEWQRARTEVAEALRRKGWDGHHAAPAVGTLTAVLVRMTQLGYTQWGAGAIDTYLDAAERVAESDVDYVLRAGDRDAVVDGVVVLTVLGDIALGAARRIAHQEVSARRLGVRNRD